MYRSMTILAALLLCAAPHPAPRSRCVAASSLTIGLQTQEPAEYKQDHCFSNPEPRFLSYSGRGRAELGREQYSQQAAEDKQPTEDRHNHRPAAAPTIVHAHDRKPGNEGEHAGC